MKERPILFSAPMVRAILAGTKTLTRRVLANQPQWDATSNPPGWRWNGTKPGEPAFYKWPNEQTFAQAMTERAVSRYGNPGERLWVRETWRAAPEFDWAAPREVPKGTPIYFDATADDDMEANADNFDHCPSVLRRSSIHMPRWASRILLEVVSVRVERLGSISRGDAMAEGCPFPNMAKGADPREWYADMWRQLHGADSWAANPWVWVIEFKRVAP